MKLNKLLVLSILFISALSLSLLKNKKNSKQKDTPVTNQDSIEGKDKHIDSDVS